MSRKRKKAVYRRWTAEEDHELRCIAGDDALKFVSAKFNKWLKSQGLSKRTTSAIVNRCSELGLSLRPQQNGWSASAFADLIKADRSRVSKWIHQLGLVTTRTGKRQRVHRIGIDDFIDFARLHPERLRTADRDALAWLLPPEVLELVPAQYRYAFPVKEIKMVSNRPVVTRVYPSLSAAARSNGCSLWYVKQSIATGCCASTGARFEEVDGRAA
jgi:hypothetical protein